MILVAGFTVTLATGLLLAWSMDFSAESVPLVVVLAFAMGGLSSRLSWIRSIVSARKELSK